jgi:hypothetical protein
MSPPRPHHATPRTENLKDLSFVQHDGHHVVVVLHGFVVRRRQLLLHRSITTVGLHSADDCTRFGLSVTQHNLRSD